MSMMLVIVLHRYTEFEFYRAFLSEDMGDFRPRH